MKASKPTLKYRVDPDLNNKFHFFLSSCGQWITGQNLDELIARMKRSGLTFNVFYVPLPKDAPYEISSYAPKVEGAKFLGYYGFEDLSEEA